jgi:catechol 2,3-dioxygenase-like lactoylglutathione lyase family enzyme
MAQIRRFDHVGITVADLDTVTEFFAGLGLNELGLRSVSFEVDDLQAAVDRLRADGYGLVGGIGQHENIWRMAYVRGPEGIIVSLAERIDRGGMVSS